VRPLVVVEAGDEHVADAIRELRAAGWEVVPGWKVPPGRARVVCTGAVESAADAAEALLAAVAGAGLVVAGRAGRDVLDRLCDDLRRLGTLDHRTQDSARRPRLTAEESALVELLLEGLTLGAAARRLAISRRTADRRLASVRQALGVETTAEALVRLGRPP
jgi:DNA-binding NarL/FixJ family response regulator